MKHVRLFSTIALVTYLAITSASAQQDLQQVQPPFWWTGMVDKEVQVLVHGDDIGKSEVSMRGPGVEIVSLDSIHRPDNANYLFLDLTIADTREGSGFEFGFTSPEGATTWYYFELKARRPGSAERKGFDNSDVMYLITPDRYANGDPENDSVEGLREKVDRNNKDGRHGGDLAGIIEHLDYISDMGFTSIWLNPILVNDQAKYSYHGYSTTDYYKVDPRYGSNRDYVKMSQLARERGMSIIMDIIVNHCGSMHWWMDDRPFDDWIHDPDTGYVQTNHAKTTLLDPYVVQSDRDKMVKGWFVPTMPDLNQKNPYMSRYLIQNSIWWIEYADLSGIRQDTYSYPYRKFMTDWTCAIMREYPDFSIVGEEWVLDPSMVAYWQRGKKNQDGYTSCLSSLMDFPMNAAIPQALNSDKWPNGLRKLYEVIGSDYHYADPFALVTFPDNHDMSRIYTQVNEDYDLFRMAIAYILTMRGTPQLYYGTEILMTHTGDNSHGAIRSDFPGGWEGDASDAKDNSTLSAEAVEAKEFVRTLLNWRKDNETIHSGRLAHYYPEDKVYVFFRYLDDSAVMVILNKNLESKSLQLERFAEHLDGFNSGKDVISGKDYELDDRLQLPANGPLILELY